MSYRESYKILWSNGNYDEPGSSIEMSIDEHPAISDVLEDREGKMYLLRDDSKYNSLTQINFNPFTGEKAKVQIKEN